MYTEKAIEALKASEATLRELITQALAANAYRDLAIIAGAADALASLIVAMEEGKPEVNASSIQELQHDRVPSKLIKGAKTPVLVSAQASTKALSRRDSYPRFLRDGDRLLKIAWSKKERRPYEHRAPRMIIQTLLDTVRKRKGEGKIFEAAEVLPLVAENGEEYPSYQSYLALSWLRQVGIVTKKGREGYVVKPRMATPAKLDQLWASLPTQD